MKQSTVILFTILLLWASHCLAQSKTNIVGTYSVSINPKEVITIKKRPQNGYFTESNQGWAGTIFDYDKTRFDGTWQYSDTLSVKKLRGLAGDHVCVLHKDGSLTVTITPFDGKLPTSVVKWRKLAQR